MSLYAFIGTELCAALSDEQLESSAYGEWVHTYASAEFKAAVRELDDLLERLLEDQQPDLDAKKRSAQALYAEAMRLEFGFFDAQSLPPTWAEPRAAADVARLDAALRRRMTSGADAEL